MRRYRTKRMELIGLLISALARDQGVPIRELARLAGIRNQTLLDIVHGRVAVRRQTLAKIEEALDLDTGWIRQLSEHQLQEQIAACYPTLHKGGCHTPTGNKGERKR